MDDDKCGLHIIGSAMLTSSLNTGASIINYDISDSEAEVADGLQVVGNTQNDGRVLMHINSAYDKTLQNGSATSETPSIKGVKKINNDKVPANVHFAKDGKRQELQNESKAIDVDEITSGPDDKSILTSTTFQNGSAVNGAAGGLSRFKDKSHPNRSKGNTQHGENGRREHQSGESGAKRVIASIRRKRDGDQMPINHFEFWYDALERDDVQLIEQILSSCSDEEKRTLINGRFVYDCRPFHTMSSEEMPRLPCAYQRPLVLAAIFTATHTIQLFLLHKADLFVQDIGANTVIHGLIKAASLKPTLQDHYVAMYDFIVKKLNPREKRRLLFFEDADGLRPLELAARLRTFLLFQRIFDTDGVYLFKNGILGAHLCTWYDVTEYESWTVGKRRELSPLRMLTMLEKEFLLQAKASGFVSHPAIRKWMSYKILTNVPYLVLWFMVRSLYTALIFICAVADEDTTISNTTVINGSFHVSEHVRCPQPLILMEGVTITILTILVMCFSLVILLFDLGDLSVYTCYSKKKDRRCYPTFSSKNFVVKTRFYRVCNFLLAAAVVIFHTSRRIEHLAAIMLKAYMMANILNIWSLLFFIQLLPALGYFVTIIQRMMKDMFHFLILYVILFFSFSQTFFNLFYLQQVCSPEFTDIFWSMYSTFRVMLNMIEVTDGFKNPTDIAILHTTYVIVVPILLVNFLIALMSNSVSDVAENRQVIMLLQRLSAAILVESRLGRAVPWIYRWQQKNYYVTQGDRIYVECFVMKKRDLNTIET